MQGQALNTAFKRFKEIADRKKTVTAMDLEALVTDELREEIAGYSLESIELEAGTRPRAARARSSCARRTARSRAARAAATARSTRCSRRSTPRPGIDASLREFRIDAVTEGQDALGEVSVVVECDGADRVRAGGRDGHRRGGRARVPARADDARLRRERGDAARPDRHARRGWRLAALAQAAGRLYVITYERMALPAEPEPYDATASARACTRCARRWACRCASWRCAAASARRCSRRSSAARRARRCAVAARIAAGLELRLSQLLRLDESGAGDDRSRRRARRRRRRARAATATRC